MQHGVKNVSMDEIASKLGMSKRTIYQHFTDKEDILVYFIKAYESDQWGYILKLSGSLPTVVDIFWHIVEMQKTKVPSYCVKFQEDIEKSFPKAQRLLENLHKESIVHVKNLLKKGVNQGVIRSDLNLEVTAFLLQDMDNTYLHASRMLARPFTILELFHTMMINFIRGISTRKGIEIIDNYLQKENQSKNS